MAREYVTQSELEAALQALQEPGRFEGAERLVTQAAPGLHRILIDALASGGWGADDDARALDAALAAGDAGAVLDRLGSLLAEQTRVAMLVGVAVGVELARELGLASGESPLAITHHGTEGDHQ
jgi:hypothetical protein